MDNRFFEHPILNSPYEYPTHHWELDDQGQPTQQIIAIPRFKGKGRMYDGAVATVSSKEIAIAVQGLIAAQQIIDGFVTDRPTLTVTVERQP